MQSSQLPASNRLRASFIADQTLQGYISKWIAVCRLVTGRRSRAWRVTSSTSFVQRARSSESVHRPDSMALFSPETVSKTISVEEKRAYLQSEFDRHSADPPLCLGAAVVTLGLLQSRDLNQQFTRHASWSYSVDQTLLPGFSEDDRHLEGECSGMCTPLPVVCPTPPQLALSVFQFSPSSGYPEVIEEKLSNAIT